MKKNQIVIITGSHRSGTTWLGRVLSAQANVEYVAEPFNPSFNHYKNPLDLWFQYLNENNITKNQKKYLNANFSFGLSNLLFKERNALSKKWWGTSVRMLFKQRHIQTKIVKDPIAVFSTPFLSEKYNCKVIVTLRHPCAFVASVNLKGWKFDFKQLLQQSELMTCIAPYEEAIKSMANRDDASCIEQTTLLWNIVYNYLYVQKENPQFYFVKNEALSLEPDNEIEKICNYIQLPFDEVIKSKIIETTSGGRASNTLKNSMNDSIIRDSKQHVDQWKSRLTESEIEYILKETETIRALYDY